MFEEGQNSSEAEKAILGIDHKDAGIALAQQWPFPESLSVIIKHHHRPENAVHYKDLVHIIYLADLLMSRFHLGLEFERLNTDTLGQRLERLGFSIQSLPDIVDMIPGKALVSSPGMVNLEEDM